jgi:hypothetical protein
MAVVCQHSTKERRRVSSEAHRQAFTEYGLSYPQARGAFEVDHLIPLELGGDNTIANLWPEAAEPAPGFPEKDRVSRAGRSCSTAYPRRASREEPGPSGLREEAVFVSPGGGESRIRRLTDQVFPARAGAPIGPHRLERAPQCGTSRDTKTRRKRKWVLHRLEYPSEYPFGVTDGSSV